VPLDELESYLRQIRVLDQAAWHLRGSYPSYRLLLEGGIAVLSKPEDEHPEGPKVVRQEVAAWAIARALAWADLLSATVLREVDSALRPGKVMASIQVLWPDDNQPGQDPNDFPPDDLWRAAVFDGIIGHSDRHGGNWLAVPKGGTPPRLKLIDHAYGFPPDASPPNSELFVKKRGERIPSWLKADLKSLLQNLPGPSLPDLLDPQALAALSDRVARLSSYATLYLP
jgi:hypothetical protein